MTRPTSACFRTGEVGVLHETAGLGTEVVLGEARERAVDETPTDPLAFDLDMAGSGVDCQFTTGNRGCLMLKTISWISTSEAQCSI